MGADGKNDPVCISIHFLHTEEDRNCWNSASCSGVFQSTSSIRRKTVDRILMNSSERFQSTSSIRRKTLSEVPIQSSLLFQSTSSIRRKTMIYTTYWKSTGNFNPLPPYGGRLAFWSPSQSSINFNPLPPYGGRPRSTSACVRSYTFQSTSSIRRKTAKINNFV